MTGSTSPTGAALRAAVLQQRRDLVARLQAMPPEMADRPQWLLWKLIDKPGAVKPAKVPFYVSGQLRGWPNGKPKDGVPTAEQPQVEQGHALDRAHLVSLAEALRAFDRSPAWAGVGFAFLPGDGLIGVDIDGAVDPATGEVSALCADLVARCASYAETSVSGKGVHIILTGTTDKFKSDRIGLEVYAGSQYFTCTGQPFGDRLPVAGADPVVMADMRAMVDAANEAERLEREAERTAARARAAAAAPPRPAPAPRGRDGRDDFRLVNDEALARLDRWVPSVLPGARAWGVGYRITSKALGRDLQEDLQLLPSGIYDFGEEEAKSPIDVVMQWRGMAAPKDALHWLADAIGVELAPLVRRRHQPAAPIPTPPPAPDVAEDRGAGESSDGEPDWAAAALDGQHPPEIGAEVAHTAGEGEDGAGPTPTSDDPPPDAPGGGRNGRRKVYPPEFWDQIDRMLDRYALVYGSNQVWDLEQARFIEVPHLRLACGATPVNFWLASQRRKMVNPEDLVFEPGVNVPEGKVNLFQGIKVQPLACTDADVAPMLRLLRHLCATSVLVQQAGDAEEADDTRPDDVDAVMHWVLCWCAYPHQHLGAKMRTALIFHGSQGTGKNLFFDAWRDTFGDLGKTVGQTELEEKYNAGWLSRTLAIVGDEVVSKAELYHNKNRLKMIVTQEHRFPIRAMHCDVRYETNHANVVFTSNEDMPLALEDRDRRYLVVYTPLEADTALYDEVKAFLQGDGIAKWLHYLQHYPLGDFDRHTKPLMTRAKQLLIEANWKPTQRFVAEWIGGYLDLPRRACSREQAFRAFRRWVENTGVKWAADQATFVREINRWANEQRVRQGNGELSLPPFELRKVRMPEGSLDKEVGDRRYVWMLIHLPGGPNTGVSIGDWSVECMREFASPLSRFCGHTGRPPGDDKDKAGGAT